MSERLFQGNVTVRFPDGSTHMGEAWFRPQPASHVYAEPALNAVEHDGGTAEDIEHARWLLAAWDGESPVSWEQTVGDTWMSYAVFPYTPSRIELLVERVAARLRSRFGSAPEARDLAEVA